MIDSKSTLNGFEQLCVLASHEKWCWKLVCTTCGHTHFRYALMQLANGLSPNDKEWIIHNDRTNFESELGQIPRIYSEISKDKVIRLCSTADLVALSRTCLFPDWLGYLGLILYHMNYDSDSFRMMNRKWAAQLVVMVHKDAKIHNRLKIIAEGSGGYLRLEDLEDIEESIKLFRS